MSIAAIQPPAAIYREEQFFAWWLYALLAAMVGIGGGLGNIGSYSLCPPFLTVPKLTVRPSTDVHNTATPPIPRKQTLDRLQIQHRKAARTELGHPAAFALAITYLTRLPDQWHQIHNYCEGNPWWANSAA